MALPTIHPMAAGTGVGAFIGLSHFAAEVSPILADLSYLAGFVLGILGIISWFRTHYGSKSGTDK